MITVDPDDPRLSPTERLMLRDLERRQREEAQRRQDQLPRGIQEALDDAMGK
jgi:hypothetical protein